jgi:hypothetical protein
VGVGWLKSREPLDLPAAAIDVVSTSLPGMLGRCRKGVRCRDRCTSTLGPAIGSGAGACSARPRIGGNPRVGGQPWVDSQAVRPSWMLATAARGSMTWPLPGTIDSALPVRWVKAPKNRVWARRSTSRSRWPNQTLSGFFTASSSSANPPPQPPRAAAHLIGRHASERVEEGMVPLVADRPEHPAAGGAGRRPVQPARQPAQRNGGELHLQVR